MIKELESKIGYKFQNIRLLKHAITHSSYANENRQGGYTSNERLEFLGDSVLGQITAEYLFRMEPEIPEGNMSKFRSELVCETALYEVAKQLELGRYIRLGKGEDGTGGRERPSILADAVEAVIAAIYLDGGYRPAKDFIDRFVLSAEIDYTAPSGDWKTELQELVQRTPDQTIRYELLEESGPDHNKRFTFGVYINGVLSGKGMGRTKKEAEQLAAQDALKGMKQ